MNEMHVTAIMVLAFFGDAFLGDPPNRFHPVVWMGNAISLVRKSAPLNGNAVRFLLGLALVIGGMVVVGYLGWAVQRACQLCPFVLNVVIQAVVLKCTFSIRSLAKASRSVCESLRMNRIDEARHHVAYNLVSRDVSNLDASKLSAATIESVSENTSDSVIAPLFYFVLGGLPGALVYRFINTCDAMVGYRTPELEWFGKAAARTDDLLNIIPSRITAVLILVLGGLRTMRLREGVAIWWRDRRLTASPNAGHPMSAAAGVLGVVLEKEGHYVLGADQSKPTFQDIERAIWLLWATSIAGGLLFLAGTTFYWRWAAS